MLIDVARRAMNYADNSSDDDFYSDDNYSVSENGMPKLRRNDDSNSDDNSNDDSLSTDGYDYESNSDNSYVDELSYSDDESDQMPDLYMNRDDNSSVNNSDDKTILTGGYDYESASDDELYSGDDKSFSNDSGWAWKERAQDLEAAKVREDREHRQRLAIIQDIYVREKHGGEQRTTYTTPARVQSQTPLLPSSPQRVSSTFKQEPSKYEISANARLRPHHQYCKPTTNQYPARMRGRALNQLLHGTPDVSKQIKAKTQSSTTSAKQIKATTKSSTTGVELPMYFVNAIIDEATGEVNIPSIVDCDTGMINAVIDPVTGEQKPF